MPTYAEEEGQSFPPPDRSEIKRHPFAEYGASASCGGMKREANNGEIEFLRAEVLTGANVSRELRWGHEVKNKNRRNRVNARKAHDSLLRFMAHVTAKTAAWEEIRARVAEFRFHLQTLGEQL